MEQAKEEGGRPLSELFRMLIDQRKGEELYKSFTDVLEAEIKTPEVRHDLVVNILKFHATVEAARKVKIGPTTPESEATTRELTDCFEIECKLLCEDVMKLPELFREKMTRKTADGFDLLAVILGSCNCENCKAYREGSRKEEAAAAVPPTEPPPPPEQAPGVEAPLG